MKSWWSQFMFEPPGVLSVIGSRTSTVTIRTPDSISFRPSR